MTTGATCRLALALSLIAGCGSPPATATPEPSPTPVAAAPSPTAAPQAEGGPPTVSPAPTPERTVVFTAALVPKVTNEERTASGDMRVVFELERDGQQIRSATATFEFSVRGLPSDARVHFAHIHEGSAAVEGPIVQDTGLSPGILRTVGGSGSIAGLTQRVDPQLAARILADPPAFYFMIHSARNPDGFIRGQLRPE